MRLEISFSVSPRVQTSTPTKYKKQIRLLKQKLRRRAATIRNMKGLLDNLKNKGIVFENFMKFKKMKYFKMCEIFQ